MIILCIFNINYILLEISGSHSNIIRDSYVFHYGNELVSRTGNKEIRHFVTANFDQSTPLHPVQLAALAGLSPTHHGGLETTFPLHTICTHKTNYKTMTDFPMLSGRRSKWLLSSFNMHSLLRLPTAYHKPPALIDWLSCGFTSYLTQNRSFRRRSHSQSPGLVWKN